MKENYTLVQEGFRCLLPVVSDFIGRTMYAEYKDGWWGEVLYKMQNRINDLPQYGKYQELVDSMDIACCFQLMQRAWNDVFYQYLEKKCRSWVIELLAM